MRLMIDVRSYLCGVLALFLLMPVSVPAAAQSTPAAQSEEEVIARSLAALLRSSRTVISNHQNLINDPGKGDKGLTPEKVLKETAEIYKTQTGVALDSIKPDTRHGRLLQAQLDSISTVMKEVQPVINKRNVGFKGIIPSAFARMVNDRFQEKMADEAEVKVTAPPELIRNRKARPDNWETDKIASNLSKIDWPKGQPLSEVAGNRGRQAFRFLVPEYYAASCLTCHGVPKGQIDVTGYPKEGGKEGDLGGVISISIYKR